MYLFATNFSSPYVPFWFKGGHRADRSFTTRQQEINNRSHCLYRRPAIRAQAMRAWATQEEPAADEDQTEPSE